ncbi:MAG: cupin domain-containing protein [Bacteroidota bacterium]
MERRDFLYSSSIVTAALALPSGVAEGFQPPPVSEPIGAFLVPSLPPLDHKGSMDIRVCVRSAMTNGLYSSVECAVAPKTMGPSPHYHKELDEMMFVLDGTASVLVGKEVVEVSAGGWHLRPRGITHTFWNSSDRPLRFIDMYFHQAFEEYLELIFHTLTPENGYPDNSEKKKIERDRMAEKFGLVHSPTAREERKAIAQQYGLK